MRDVTLGRGFAWLHHANGDQGAVTCAAVGYEGLRAQESWRVPATRRATHSTLASQTDQIESEGLDAPRPAGLRAAAGYRSQNLEQLRPRAVICVPTFRRPEMLARTLASIETQETNVEFAVVVVDNDGLARQGVDVARAAFERNLIKGLVAVEERQGNVHAINAAFGLARAAFPSAEYLLMIDDDEYAEPLWLDQMIDAAISENVNIVGGPVFPVFPCNVAAAFRDHPVYRPSFSKSGPVPMIYGTGNCLIATKVFDNPKTACFDTKFNFLGGGDTEFFTRCRDAGYTFAWRQEARIWEHVTQNRLTLKWVMQRSIATGVINYRIDRLAAPHLTQRIRLFAKNVALAPISVQRAIGILSTAKHPLVALHPIGVALGRWLASIGFDPKPYRRRTS